MCRGHTSTGLDPLVPRVTKLGVAGLAALLEPGTPAKAATASAGVLVDATHGAYGADWRCDGVHVWALGTEYTEIQIFCATKVYRFPLHKKKKQQQRTHTNKSKRIQEFEVSC